MKDWRDDVTKFLRENDENYFTVEWLSNRFNTTIEAMADLMDQLEGLDIIHHINLYIDLKHCRLHQYNR